MRILPAAAYMSEVWGWERMKIKAHCASISAITHDNYHIHAANDFCIDLMLGYPMGNHIELKGYFQQTNGVDGWVMNTLRIVHEALNASTTDFMDGLWYIAKQGGDTDTACAIYAAICGYNNASLVEDETLNALLCDSSIVQLRNLFDITLHRYTPNPKNPNLIAGQYPGASETIAHAIKSVILIDEKIDVIVNLMEYDELERFTPYEAIFQQLRPDMCIEHFPIRDMDIPDYEILKAILKSLNTHLPHQKIYIHCWGGHGRTGTIIGAYLVESGWEPQDALNQIASQRRLTPFGDQPSPQTREQIAAVWSVRAEIEN